MITLYLDMDGVLADFNKAYLKFDPKKEDRKRFRSAVMEYKIFEDLDFMPDTQELLNHVSRLQNVHIEILTSMGTHDPVQGNETKRQKLKWLDRYNIPYKANFVRSKVEKSEYANEHSILIDDSVGCISPFIKEGGHGILHTNASETISILDATINNIRALSALRS
jgi:phosphoglycolate phosphatase-like HAD superfamily hydrolase